MMKKKVFRERYYEKHIGDFKVLSKEEIKEAKAEVIEEKSKKGKKKAEK